jgi:hypothetical protein
MVYAYEQDQRRIESGALSSFLHYPDRNVTMDFAKDFNDFHDWYIDGILIKRHKEAATVRWSISLFYDGIYHSECHS